MFSIVKEFLPKRAQKLTRNHIFFSFPSENQLKTINYLPTLGTYFNAFTNCVILKSIWKYETENYENVQTQLRL